MDTAPAAVAPDDEAAAAATATAAAAAEEEPSPAASKKPKLLSLTLDDGAAAAAETTTTSRSHHQEKIPAPEAGVLAAPGGSAVTALAVWEDDDDETNANATTIVFSGHRNGTIRRWDLGLDDNNSSSHTPRWCIPSCTDLTIHPTYGSLEYLGVAGLVVRRRRSPNQDKSTDDHDSSSTSGSSSLPPLQLYSWNCQREDMRADINGIPNKVMIWNVETGERIAALMIDVGRCSITKRYANPLPSCLVFAPLLLPEPTKTKTARGKTTTQEDDDDKAAAAVSLEWTDTILVGLQATCTTEEPVVGDEATPVCPRTGDDDDNNNKADADTAKPAAAVTAAAAASLPAAAGAPPKIFAAGGQALPPAIAAKLGRMGGGGAALQQQKPPTTTSIPTGNLLPFCERSRKRLAPWTAPGGFVRALACVPRRYVIGITETVTTTTATAAAATATGSQTTTNSANSAAEEKDEGAAAAPRQQQPMEDAGKKPIDRGGGQASEIILWDATQPGTVLHRLKLWNNDPGISCATATTRLPSLLLRGTVFGVFFQRSPSSTARASSCQDLVVACRGETTKGNGWTALVQIHIHDDEPAGSSGTAKEGATDDGDGATAAATISIGKSVDIDAPCSAAWAVNGGIVALAEAASSDVILYDENLSEKARETLPMSSNNNKTQGHGGATTTPGPNALVVAGSSTGRDAKLGLIVVAGYANGLLLTQALAAAAAITTQQQQQGDSGEPQYHNSCCCSCSTAPPGLRGMLCPHLTAASNRVRLQNQCTMQ